VTYILALEGGIEPSYEKRLEIAAWSQGWDVVRVENIPFTNQFVYQADHLPCMEELLQNKKVWFHGSIQAAKRAQKVTAWQVHAPWEQLDCQVYYSALRDLPLQKQHQIIYLGELKDKVLELFYSPLADQQTLFVRPTGADKLFNGGCIQLETFNDQWKLITTYEPPLYSKIVIARPQHILMEARFLVVDQQIVTGSLYRSGRSKIQCEAPPELISIAMGFLDECKKRHYNPAVSWVLDLAQTSEGWSVIEVGATSCCGLYDCNLDQFMEALTGVMDVCPTDSDLLQRDCEYCQYGGCGACGEPLNICNCGDTDDPAPV